MIRKIQYIFIALFIFFSVITKASEKIKKSKASQPEDSTSEVTQELIETNITIAEWFDSVAEGIDLFLAGKKFTRRENKSYLKIENTTFYNQGDSKETSVTSFHVNLRLPNLEEYWHLKFSDYDENKDRGIYKNYKPTESRPKNYGATVGVSRNVQNIRVSFSPRIQLQSPISISHSLAFENVLQFKKFNINPKLEIFADAEKGVGLFQALNFNFPLNREFSLSLLNQGEYIERTYLYTVDQGPSLDQRINENQSLSYRFIITSKNQPNYRLNSYSLSTAWNHQLLKNILEYSITPYIRFSEELSFTGRTGISANVGLIF